MEEWSNRRSDRITAAIVDKGIEIQGEAGTAIAAIFLSSKNVSLDVALRVLNSPAQRRNKGMNT